MATKVSALLGPNFKATDKDLSGKSFTSEGDAAKEASDFFSQYFGGKLVIYLVLLRFEILSACKWFKYGI